ncbi:hypothetical protein BJ912DRAFT_1077780 [Pholiota molesta]|nr:hypothetical protein BJ912DRAFT_1077780 [Pholiota molesta]
MIYFEEFIRFTWVDFSNTVRFRTLPVSYFKKLLASRRPGIGIAKACLGLNFITLADGFSPMGEYLYVPDLKSLRLCPYEPGQVSVMGFFQEKTPWRTPEGTLSVETKACTRGALKRVVDQARDELGVEFLVGFESEFILLAGESPYEPVSTHEFSSSQALRAGAVATIVMDEIARQVQASDIELQMYHGEASPGQYEVITGPLAPLEAADALVHTREIIYNVAARHGLRATFAPRIFANAPGSAAHAHISVHSARPGNEKDATGLSALEQTFLAGVAAHLPSLPALTLPLPASYARVGDGQWSGGTHVCWGTENRECPVRLAAATAPRSRRFEMRFVDGTAHPHLALAGYGVLAHIQKVSTEFLPKWTAIAGILGAGAGGVRVRTPLTLRDCAGPLTAAQMTDAERVAHGIVARMPLTWAEARANFQRDEELKSVFGQELVDMYLSVNKAVGEALEQPQNDETYGGPFG